MNLAATARLAISRILATPTRSFLTMLGVIIGVASLVALTSIANGATSGVTSSLTSLGATTITVSSTGTDALTDADAAALTHLPGVVSVATTTSGRGEAVLGLESDDLTLTGVSSGYAAVLKPTVAVGRFLPAFAGSGASRTVVLSASAANSLKVTPADVGSRIVVAGQPFTLGGVLDDATGFGASGVAYVSMTAARTLFAQAPTVSSVLVNAADTKQVDAVQAEVDQVLRARYGLGPDDSAQYSISNPSSIISSVGTVQSLLSVLVGGIASISLLVGGIGIMNIMLVSVRERTREIGVRRAIGARRGQILAQFLVEAIVLSVLGGILGLLAGIGLSALVALVAGWAFVLAPTTVVLALVFSVVVGVVFGVWPARSAARLQVVDALRFE